MTTLLLCQSLRSRVRGGMAAVLVWVSQAVSAQYCQTPTQVCSGMVTSTCSEGAYWETPLDLDGDGRTDFLLAHRWAVLDCERSIPPAWQRRTVATWALFPEAHVQVLGWVQWPVPALPQGYPIVPDPTQLSAAWTRSAWAVPQLQPHIRAYGLGYTVESYSCGSSLPGETCPLPQAVGWVGWWTTNALFGVRMARADGWHLGWMRAGYYRPEKSLADGRSTRVDLDDYAIHPDPDTEINAGEPPRPRLWHDLERDALRLRWLPVWAEYRLERTRDLSAAAWEPVSGVTNQSATLPAREGPWYFRLAQPPAPNPNAP